MADVKDGGPAFSYTLPPGAVPVLVNGRFNNAGMSKRFYAACAAMQAGLANPSAWYAPTSEEKASGITWAHKLAKEAFEVADALIEEEGKS